MAKLKRTFVICALIISGVVFSLGTYLFCVGACIVFVSHLNNPVIRYMASLYATSSLLWIMVNEVFYMIIYYLYLKWIDLKTNTISDKMRIVFVIIVYLLSVVLLKLARN